MKRLLPLLLCGLAVSLGHAAELKTPGDRMFAEYFKIETKRLADSCLAEIETLDAVSYTHLTLPTKRIV